MLGESVAREYSAYIPRWGSEVNLPAANEGVHAATLHPTGYPPPSVTLKARGCNFVRKRPTITFEVSEIPQNV